MRLQFEMHDLSILNEQFNGMFNQLVFITIVLIIKKLIYTFDIHTHLYVVSVVMC